MAKLCYYWTSFHIFSLLNSKNMRMEVELELSPPLKYVAALPCEMLSGQLNCTSLHP